MLVGYTSVESWDRTESNKGNALGRTDCDGARRAHKVDIPFVIRTGEVTLLALPGGKVGFSELSRIELAISDPYVRRNVSSWLPHVQRARLAAHADLVERRREPRDGYDVYRDCDGRAAAVVRDARSRRTRGSAAVARGQPLALRVWGTGHGAGCVRRSATVWLIPDATEIESAIRAAGQSLIESDTDGEIDIIISPIPTPLGASR